jgi:NAD(P)H dehydrogenase (quinone)
MKILVVYAHPEAGSFCHAVLRQFVRGLVDAGHTHEVVDLYAIGFDPVLKSRDVVNWLPDENAPDIVDKVVKERVFAPGAGLLQRLFAWRMFRGRSPLEIVRLLRQRGPRDVREQQEKVARADALVFIAPVWFVGFPAILKGWFDRVFTMGFAFSMTSSGWHGDLRGRIGLLRHQKALIISTTIFDEPSYRETGLREARRQLIDEFCLQYPGIAKVEHEYFHAVNLADEATRGRYLERAYALGREF